MRRRYAALGAMMLAVTLSVAAPRVAEATVVVPLTREELATQSDLVVRATVLSRRSAWNDDHTQIMSWTRIRVTEYLKGTGDRELVIRQIGGEVDGLASAIPGDGRLVPGQHAVLFLRRGEGVVFLTALAQSVFYVAMTPDGSPVVRRELGGLTFARWVNGRMTAFEPPAEASEGLEQFVRAVRVIVTAPNGGRAR